jgi:putative hemolysin
MDIAARIGVLIFLILLGAFFAAAEISLVSVSDAKIRSLAEQGNRRARLIERTTHDSTRFLATIQIGVTLLTFLTSALAAKGLEEPVAKLLKPIIGGGELGSNIALGLVTVLTASISLIFSELVPKRLALRKAESVAMFTIQPIHWLGRLTYPLVRFFSATTNLILRLTGNPPSNEEDKVSVEEVKAMVDAARAGGAVGEQQKRIIYGAVELSSITARAIMVPRVQIQFFQVNTPLQEVMEIVSQNAHTRLPVCDGDIDKVLGILHVKDLVLPLVQLQDPALDLRELVRPVRFVPENKLASELLREMQRDRLHLVIVRDEFGGTAGLVTLEDVLEEIVGEIRDEYDAEEEKEFRRVDEDTAIFNVRASLATVNNELDLHLPREEAATIAGLFLEELQRNPEPGDSVEFDQTQLLVLEDGQRVQVSRLPDDEAEDEDEN